MSEITNAALDIKMAESCQLLCWEIEKLPASEQQTKVSVMASELQRYLSGRQSEYGRNVCENCKFPEWKMAGVYICKNTETPVRDIDQFRLHTFGCNQWESK